MRSLHVALAAYAALLLLAAPALAHAEPEESSPRFGAELDGPPTQIWIRFTQPIDDGTSRFQIINSSLAEFPVGPITVSERGLLATAALPEPLPPGSYAIKWSVLSLDDGHTTKGAIPFTVATDEPLIDVPAGVETPKLRADAVIGKTFAFTGMAVVIGAFGFWYLVLPRGYRKGHEGTVERVALVAAWLHLAGALIFAYSQYDLAGLALSEYVTTTRIGAALAARIVLGGVMVGALWYAARRPDVPRGVWAATSALAALTFLVFGVSSHSAGRIQPGWFGMLTDGLHLISVGVWFGGLVTFVLFLRELPREEAGLVEHLRVVPPRFSTMAMWSVGVAAATGAFMSWSIMGFDVAPWNGTTYGRLLAFKVLLAFAMIGLGAINRFVFVRRYQRGAGATSVRAFRSNVRREVVLGTVVFLLAGMLTNSSPPGTVSDRPGAPDDDFVYFGEDRLTLQAQTPHYNWTVTFHPEPALGENTHFIVDLFGRETNARDRDAHPVRMFITNTDEPDLGTTTVPLNVTQSGTYETFGTFFSVPGTYEVVIEASSGSVGAYREQVSFTFDV